MTSRRDSTDGGAQDPERRGSSVRSRWGRDGRPSTAVVEAVADALGREPFELSPLQHHVDADALDALAAGRTGDVGDGVCITFQYEGFDVAVDSDGVVLISPVAAD